MAYIIAEPCIGTKDTACVDACPVDCIHPKKDTQYEDGRPGFEQVDQLFIDPVECIDCGACVPVCPFRRSLRWTTFPRSGTPTLKRTPATSKEASSSRTNTGQGSCPQSTKLDRLAHWRTATILPHFCWSNTPVSTRHAIRR